MKTSAATALALALIASSSAPALAQCPQQVVDVYYPPNMLTPGVCPFSAATLPSGAIAGVDYTASMSPGTFPRTACSPPEAWAPVVNAWTASLNRPQPPRPQHPTIVGASAGGSGSSTTDPPVITPAMSPELVFFPGSAAITALQSTSAQVAPILSASAVSSPIVNGSPAPVVVQQNIQLPETASTVATNNVADNDNGLGVSRRRRRSRDRRQLTGANQGDLLSGSTTTGATAPVVQQDTQSVVSQPSPSPVPETQTQTQQAPAPAPAAGTTTTFGAIVGAATSATTVTTYPNVLGTPATKLWNGAELKAIKYVCVCLVFFSGMAWSFASKL